MPAFLWRIGSFGVEIRAGGAPTVTRRWHRGLSTAPHLTQLRRVAGCRVGHAHRRRTDVTASAAACICAPVAPEYTLTFDRIGADDESISTRCKRLFRPVRLCRHRLCLRQSSRCLCIELGCARTRGYRIPYERMRALPCHSRRRRRSSARPGQRWQTTRAGSDQDADT